jgi:nucleotide-binding universal stress UspA family protein
MTVAAEFAAQPKDRAMIKDLALLVDGRTQKVGPYASSLALLLDGHLTAVSAIVEPYLASYAYAELRYDLILSAREEMQEAANELVDKLKSDGSAEGLKVNSLSLDYFEDAGFDRLNEIVRIFDLVIIEQENAEEGPQGRSLTIESVVFGSGRPVLIVPYIQARPASLKNVLVAWDGSAPAARALGDALPLLARADRVELLSVGGKALKGCDGQGVAVTRHLARHGIDATFKHTTSAGDIGNTLLSHAADTGADLLVMGAYGHSRLREAVFGGTTRTLFESMTIPVLMSR